MKSLFIIQKTKTSTKFTHRKFRWPLPLFWALGEYMTYFIIENIRNNLNPKLMDLDRKLVGDVIVPGSDPCHTGRGSHIGVTVYGDMAVTYCPLWQGRKQGKISRYKLKKQGVKLYLKDGSLFFEEKGFSYRVWIPSGILLIVNFNNRNPFARPYRFFITFWVGSKSCGFRSHQHVTAKSRHFPMVSTVVWDNVLEKVIIVLQTQKPHQNTKKTFLGIDMKDGFLDTKSGFENLHGLVLTPEPVSFIFFDKVSGNPHNIHLHQINGKKGKYFQNIEVYQRVYNNS